MLAVLEAYAQAGGCTADTLQEWFRAAYYHALAAQYAVRGLLSVCAELFYGV
jgi:hypothetical protein